jgi:hypothetical protein
LSEKELEVALCIRGDLKMYKIIENPNMMSKAEIDRVYKGKWVYIVKANVDVHGTLVEGMPVVIGDYQFAGVEEGIYKQFDSDEYGRDLSYTLLPYDNSISSVFGVGVI